MVPFVAQENLWVATPQACREMLVMYKYALYTDDVLPCARVKEVIR